MPPGGIPHRGRSGPDRQRTPPLNSLWLSEQRGFKGGLESPETAPFESLWAGSNDALWAGSNDALWAGSNDAGSIPGDRPL